MADMLQKLETLNPAQLAKVFKLIDKLATKNAVVESEDFNKQFESIFPEKAVPIPAPVKIGRPATPTHQIKPGNGPQAHTGTLERKVGAARGQQRKSKSQARRGQGKPKKTFTRREPMDLSGNRPNLFDKVEDKAALHMDDHEIDKKLAVAPRVPRRPPVEYIEVECSVCGYLFEVHPSLVLKTDEGLTFTCNDCTRTSR